MKRTYGLSILFLFAAGAEALDIKVSGGIDFFSKVGLNYQAIDVDKNLYPTDTWGSVAALIETDIDLLTPEQKSKGQSLTAGIGGIAGGVIFDAGKDASKNPTYQDLFFGNYNKGNSVVALEYITTNFVLSKLFLDYRAQKDDHHVQVKVGRYQSAAQFMSGFTQGFEIDYRYKGFELWWFSSFGRAFSDVQWIYSFYGPKQHGNMYYGVHAFKPSYTFDSGFYISPFVYFSPDFYVAPMLEVGFDSDRNFEKNGSQGFRSQTKIMVLAPFHLENAQNDYRYQFLAGKNGQTLSIKQQFDINNYYFGLGWYQNFGNANAHIGTYGNAAIGPWDFWTNTVYDFGALSNALTKDAKTGYIFLGATHGKFKWDILGRMTFSPRADERAVPLNFYYTFNDHFKIWVKFEWQSVTVHPGFIINDKTGIDQNTEAPYKDHTLKNSVTSDRSHMMVTASYRF